MYEIVRTLPDGSVIGLTDDHALMKGTPRKIGFDELTCETVVDGDALTRTYRLPDGSVHAMERLSRDVEQPKIAWERTCEEVVPEKAYVEVMDAEGNLSQVERLLTAYDWEML